VDEIYGDIGKWCAIDVRPRQVDPALMPLPFVTAAVII
jgi:hypothetical protein